jgi:beta-xylosidase
VARHSPSVRRPRRALLALAAVALLTTACLPLSPNGAPTGPVQVDIGARGSRPIDFPDPFIAKFGSTYYGYSTSSNGQHFQVIKSTDAVHWSWVGDAFGGPTPYVGPAAVSNRWAKLNGNTWAPGVVERPANPAAMRYVFYYTAESTAPGTAGVMCIGRATSASPEGPFVDESSQPMLCTPERGGSIDPNPIVVDGQVYLLWQSFGIAPTEPTRIWSTPLSTDGRSVTGPSSHLTEVLYNSPEWPNIEAPTMMPAPGGGFLLFYSSGQWWTTEYRTFVQHCTSPTGGCSRIYSNAVLMSREGMAGPGSPTVFQDPSGNWMMGFHAWTPPYIGYVVVGDLRYTRSLHILPITFPDGGHNPRIG